MTCPTYRYRLAIVAQAFASLGMLYPGRVFLGVGSGEALNEVPSGGGWGDYHERAERLIEAVELIRRLWTGEWVTFNGRYYHVENARIYDLPPQRIPIYMAAGGDESMRHAGQYGDGLITNSKSAPKWRRHTCVRPFGSGRPAARDRLLRPRGAAAAAWAEVPCERYLAEHYLISDKVDRSRRRRAPASGPCQAHTRRAQ